MAKYKGREVTIVSYEVIEDIVNVTQNELNNDKAVVSLSELTLNDEEIKLFEEQYKVRVKDVQEKLVTKQAEQNRVEKEKTDAEKKVLSDKQVLLDKQVSNKQVQDKVSQDRYLKSIR